MLEYLKGIPVFYLGSLASLLAGLATFVGALPILFVRNISERAQNTMLGFGAGVMLAATSFSLIIPATNTALKQGHTKIAAVLIISFSILAGGLFLYLSDKYLPHEHFTKGKEGPLVEQIKRIWLFIFAITLHNFPEGLAVGVGFGGGNIGEGVALAIGIGLQNMPEGLAVALALITLNYSKKTALFIALLSGLVEPIAGVFGAGAVIMARPILPYALAFAAGAMLYVISHEIIPETHRSGREHGATLGLMIGFVLMMFLDVLLG